MPERPPEALDPGRRLLLLGAAREAARVRIMPRFRALTPSDVSFKSGPQDLVTLADTEAEADIAAAVRAGWPEATALGEEGVAADRSLRALMGTADPCVVIDPVDGTWNFAKGLAVFGILLAVLRGGRPAWGLLYDPVMDDWIEAAPGEGAAFVTARGERRPLSASREARDDRVSGYVTLGLFPRASRERLLPAFAPYARVTGLRCACHEYRMLAQGHVEFVLSGPTPHPWDHAAGALAVEEAGGVARFIDGSPYDARRTRGVLLSAGSEELWAKLAARFAFLAEP